MMINTYMKTFKEFIKESHDLAIDWDSDRLVGNPKVPLVAEYMV